MLFKLLFIILISSSHAHSSECVILLHGLARTHNSMAKLTKMLDELGYITINMTYPSTKFRIEKLANDAITAALNQCPDNATIHFVTHSMGGILVRQYLSTHKIVNLGRTVMLGPPNKGSQVVDKLHRFPGFKFVNGPAGMQLGTDKYSRPNQLGKADFELGIIAGTRSINPIISLLIPDKNDGKVSVENTKLKGMSDHLNLPVTHSFMMNNNVVISQVIHFLNNGVFSTSSQY